MFLANKFSRNERWQNFLTDAHGARSAAATELRRSRCCDGAAKTSSVGLILRIASLGRDAQNEEASINFPLC